MIIRQIKAFFRLYFASIIVINKKMKKCEHKPFKVYTLKDIMKAKGIEIFLRIPKMVAFIFLVLVFDYLSFGWVKSVVFAVLLALAILEVYNG